MALRRLKTFKSLCFISSENFLSQNLPTDSADEAKKYCSCCIVVEVLCQWVTGFGVLHHKFMEFFHVIEE